MNQEFIYTKSGTDIVKRWKVLYNYIPASEQDEIKQKWADFRAAMAKTLDDIEESKWQKQSH
jgi:hypothetical protein